MSATGEQVPSAPTASAVIDGSETVAGGVDETGPCVEKLDKLLEEGFSINQSIFKLKTLHQNVIEKYKSRIQYLEKLCVDNGLEIPKPSRPDIEIF